MRTIQILLVAFAVAAVPMFAQRLDGSLTGTVKDQTGAVVAGAKVTVTGDSTGVTQETVTTSAGIYTFPNLLVGTYTVKVAAKGFSPYVRRGVQVASNQVAEAHARLSVGSESTVVEVAAGAEVIDTTTSQMSNTFSTSQVGNLPSLSPLNGGLLNLAILAPNTTSQGGGVLGSGGSVGGARPRMNNFAVDGVDDNNQSVTGPLSTVVNDAVAEFSLITNQFSAEYGHSAAGQFNVVTKSGTNNVHGDMFWFSQNRKLNALDNLQKDAFDPAVGKPRFDYNMVGGTVGAPIITNKFFIFGAFQYHTRGLGATSTKVTAPTAAGLTLLNNMAANSAVKAILAQFPAAGTNNAGSETVNSTSIPLGFVNFASPDFYNEYDWHLNSDYNFSKHQVHFRYLYNRYRAPNLPAPALPQFGGSITQDVRKGIIQDVWTVSSKFINDFRFGLTHMVQDYTVPTDFANFPNVTIDSLSNFVVGPESNSPQGGGQNTYQLLNQITYYTGKHNFKAGVEGRRWISPSNFLPRARGDWYYSDLTNLVTDTVPIDFAKRGAGDGSFPGNSSALYWFVQDDVKVTTGLTLNLGLRYEWNGIPAGSNFQTLNKISNLPGVYDFRKPKSDKNNFSPRLGFAWDPTGGGKWSIRGGFGIYYDVNFTNLALLQLPPQLQSEQDPDITCSLPNAPAWCAGYSSSVYGTGGRTGVGFLLKGGLLQVNLPPTTQADARASTGGIIVDNVSPKIKTWSFGIQRQIMKNSSLEVRYLGTMASSLPVQVQTNARSAFDNGAKPLMTWFTPSAIPATMALTTPTLADFSAKMVRPYAAAGFLGSLTAFPAIGKSEYHSGSADFIHRFQHGLYFRANYTYAKGWDDSTNELFSSLVNPRRPQDGNHISQDWGRSTLDIRQKLSLSWTYQFPKPKVENAFLRKIAEGWSVNGTYLAQSGQPITAQSGVDSNGNKDSAGDRAILNPVGTGNTGTGVNTVYMDPLTGKTCYANCDPAIYTATVGYVAANPKARYVLAGVGTLTNVARNTLTSPGLNNWDMSFFKNTHITESKYFQFRFELFNAFNHRQFSYANGGVFGTSDAATEAFSYSQVSDPLFMDPKQLNGGSRAIQLGLKFIF